MLDAGLVDTNIAASLPIQVPDRDVDDVAVERQEVLSVGDVRRIANAIDPHFRLAIFVMGHMGLRLGEVAALRRRDVDLAAGKLGATHGHDRFEDSPGWRGAWPGRASEDPVWRSDPADPGSDDPALPDSPGEDRG